MNKDKLDSSFVRESFAGEEVITHYAKASVEIGLWESENIMFAKYFKKNQRILDVGCGTGRTTTGLYQLGYSHIEGLDLSTDMLNSAKRIAQEKQCQIVFHEGDATKLELGDMIYDGAIFSFNGLMQIPGNKNRIKAMKEINRVLRPNSYFVFTTHDERDAEPKFKQFWKEEKERWSKCEQDKRLIEFGDIFFRENGRESYIHIPTRGEVIHEIEEGGFTLVEDVLRSDICNESDEVKEFSFDCRFWVARKD